MCQVIYLASNPGRLKYDFNWPGLEARLYLKHLASDSRVASIQGRLESRLVTERLAQKA